jgi:protein phosphatase
VPWEGKVEFAGLTDTGLRRENNQDSFALVPATSDEAWKRHGHLYMVADGMGAHAVGELASKVAADAIPLTYLKHSHRPAIDALRTAFETANDAIQQRGQQDPDFEGTGTTATALVVHPDGVLIGHVGDSRVYRIRQRAIEQLSFDHSLSWELTRRGHVKGGLRREFIPDNVITRSLGPEPTVQVDLEGPYDVQPGDVYVLCSDGLSGPVRDEEIGVIAGSLSPSEACRFLIDLANVRGGPDNITAVVVRLVPWETSARPSPVAPPAARGPLRLPVLFQTWWLTTVFVAGAVVWGMGYVRAAANTLLIGTAGAALAGAFALWRHRRWQRISERNKRPYCTAACELDGVMIRQTARMVSQLRQAAIEEDWPIDWRLFHAAHKRAESCALVEEWQPALREYGSAIHLLIRNARSQRGAFPDRAATV